MTTAVGVYLVGLFGVGFWARGRVETHEDYIVAGRRLPLGLNTFTLLATWFGAGTLLTATDEIAAEGLAPALLEPYGAGVCLIVAGAFFAKPLWEMKLCTVTDFYKVKFGPRIELPCVVSSVLSFAGWVAVQLVALASVLEVLFGVPASYGIALIAVVAAGYTLLGGMWSVTITDFAQMILILVGVALLGWNAAAALGGGAVFAKLPEADLRLVDTGSLAKIFAAANLFLVAALGNIPSQDLGQRLFAADSARTARLSCFAAGVLYVVFGSVPVFLGLAARAFFPELTEAVIPTLAKEFMSPAAMTVFLLAVLSAVLSTIDSAILAPATTLANNFLRYRFPERVSTLALCRWSTLGVAALATALAYSGARAYEMLEQAYGISLGAFFAPLVIGLLHEKPDHTGGILAMSVGLAIWSLEILIGGETPFAMLGALGGFAAYYGWVGFNRRVRAA
jgi:Na+/proline symporter